jgi:hypothetical protein
MPWREGVTWVYSITPGAGQAKKTLTVRVERIDRGGEGELVTLSSVITGANEKGEPIQMALPVQAFRCGRDGISAPAPATEESCPTGTNCGDKSRMRVVAKEGVFMPPAEALQNGQGWGDTFAYEVTPPSRSATSLARPVPGRRESKKRVDRVEKVRTALGEVDAIRVVDQEKVVMPFRAEPFTRTTVSWYARGVGMVRMVDGDSVTELVSLSAR